MKKLLLGTIQGSIKRSPSNLAKWFNPDDFYFAYNSCEQRLDNVDVFVQTNLLKQKYFLSEKFEAYKFISLSKKPKLVFESPMFRSVYRTSHKIELVRLGWNSYQYHKADFNNSNSSSDRWKMFESKYKIARQDWKSNGEHILLLLQKPGDSSLNSIHLDLGFKKYWDWVDYTVEKIRQHTDREIVIRPHINRQSQSLEKSNLIAKKYKKCRVSENYKWMPEYGPSGGDGLQKDLENAWCAITYNSLSGVESVLSGTPLIALHQGSMCWPVAHKKLSDIENLDRTIDIDQWLNDCAYTTWTNEELRKGEAWAHLKEKYPYWKKQAIIESQEFEKELRQWKKILQLSHL